MTINGHFWIENDKGEVIFDPLFHEYRFVCMVHKCDIKKPVYYEASKERQREAMQEHILPTMKDIFKYGVEDWIEDFGYLTPEHNHCAMNVIIEKVVNKNKGHIKYGNMGWRKLDGSGDWLEFEDGDDTEWQKQSHEAYNNIVQMTWVLDKNKKSGRFI
jgi:hypothetical protein